MSFRQELTACHLAPQAFMSTDEVRYCSQCGAANPQLVSEVTNYFVSKTLELVIRKWADGDAKWADVARALMDEVGEYKEQTLEDLRLQMAGGTIPAYLYNPSDEEWVKVG